MFEFLKEYEKKPKAKNNGKDLWVSTSKPPEERLKAKYLGKFKRVLIEANLIEPKDIRIDYRRGIVFANRKKISEKKADGRVGLKHGGRHWTTGSKFEALGRFF